MEEHRENPEPPVLVSAQETEATAHEVAPLPPLEKLKEDIIKALRQNRNSLAAAMEKAIHWDLDENTLNLAFGSPFESSYVERESKDIEKIILSALNWKLSIKTHVRKREEKAQDEAKDEQVELVRDVFRGTIV